MDEEFKHVDIAELANQWRIAEFASEGSVRDEALLKIADRLPNILMELAGLRRQLRLDQAKKVVDSMAGEEIKAAQTCPFCAGTANVLPWNGYPYNPNGGGFTTTGGTGGNVPVPNNVSLTPIKLVP